MQVRRKGEKREERKRKKWQRVKVETGLAVFAADDLTIGITDAKNDPGCFSLTLLDNGHIYKTAFWHSQDMDIPAECYEDDKLNWEKYFGDPEFPQCLNCVEWQRRKVCKMSEYALEALIVGKNYSEELCDEFDWEDCYPVVSKGKIVAIYNAAWQTPEEYKNKPIINDEYMDADADDVTEG